MLIKSYLDRRGHGSRSWLAKALGCYASDVSAWVNGSRRIPHHYAVAIEQVTQGEVMRWDTRPDDWHKLWPELAHRKDAPLVLARAA